MADISGQGTSYNLPNYHGKLHLLSPIDTPFYSAIAALNGIKVVQQKNWEWQTDSLVAAAQNAALEGATATAGEQSRANVSNVLQIIQKAVEISYTKQATIHNFDGINAGIDVTVANELDHQIALKLLEFNRDMEYSFLSGTYQAPANNSTPRKTRGLVAGITTNVVANSPDAAMTSTMVNTLLQTIWNAGGIRESATATLIVNSTLKPVLTSLFFASKYQSPDRNVAGLNLQTLETDFGTLNIMLDRYVEAKTIVVCSLEQCQPVMLNIPGKGVVFSEQKASTGAYENYQIYGEVGLEYGNQLAHGKITGAIPPTG